MGLIEKDRPAEIGTADGIRIEYIYYCNKHNNIKKSIEATECDDCLKIMEKIGWIQYYENLL
jgi:hypothetical protein